MTDDDAGKLERRLKSYQEAEIKRLKGLEKDKKEPARDSELRAIRSRKRKLIRRIRKIKMRDVNYSLKYSERKLEVLNQLRDALTKSGLKSEHARVRSLSKRIKSLNKTIKRLNKAAEKKKAEQESKQTEQTTDDTAEKEENKQEEVKEQVRQEEMNREEPKAGEKKEEEKANQEETKEGQPKEEKK